MSKSPLITGVVAVTAAMSLALSGVSPVAAEEVRGMSEQEIAQLDEHLQGTSPEEVNEILSQGLTDGELAFIEEHLEATPGSEVEAQAVPAFVVVAAAWCARGALASVPTSVLTDILNGEWSPWRTYVQNAVVGCLVGELGGVAWRLLPQAAKDAAIRGALWYYLYLRGPE